MKKKKKGFKPGILMIVLAVLIAAVVTLLAVRVKKEPEKERAVLGKPETVSTVTIASTGDILIHSPILSSVLDASGYNFENIFSLAAPYYSSADLMLANLEVTLGGDEAGGYSGYPVFNCPDSIVTALKNAGVDVCLTANNHSYDTGYDGMMRTLDVITNQGLEYLGTRKSEDERYIMTRMINGIKIGMVNYTYDTRNYPGEQKSLNGITMRDEAQNLVNSFCYNDLETLYSQIDKDLYNMDMIGVDTKIVFIHWGDEYTDEPNEYETEISRNICELGADVLIGGHPHVIQKYDTLVSSSGHKCLCLYSMGNEISNQRAHIMDEDGNRGYTEDGLIFEVEISKFNNGKSKITGLRIVPTWVELSDGQYRIIVLDNERGAESWGAIDPGSAVNSYNRTIGRIGGAYNDFRSSKGQSIEPEL